MSQFTVKRTSRFQRHFYSMPERLGISKQKALEAVHEIKAAIELLEQTGTLPEQYHYSLHELEQKPWTGFMEFHALDDVLVVYLDITPKKTIRLVGIYNHALLASGQLD